MTHDFLNKYGVYLFLGGIAAYFLFIHFSPGGTGSKYTFDNYVFACPMDDRSDTKCYKVLADIQDGDCYDTGDSTECDPPTISTIYFPNSGYIEFDDCDYQSKSSKWSCGSTNTDQRENWEMTFAEKVKRLKTQ